MVILIVFKVRVEFDYCIGEEILLILKLVKFKSIFKVK